MPTYAYACKQCEHTFDAVQSFTDDALDTCPECGGPLRKQYGSIGVTFNGSGFYRTDSRSGSGSGESKKSDSGSKESSTKKESTSKDSSSSSSSSSTAAASPSST